VKIIRVTDENAARAIPAAVTVEATFGGSDKVVCGTLATLGVGRPDDNRPLPILKSNSTILITHIDLGTLFWVSGLLGIRPNAPEFWEAERFITSNGSHHLHELNDATRYQLLAYWAYAEELWGKPSVSHAEEVTQLVKEHIEVLNRIIGGDHDLIARGIEWDQKRWQAVEECLVEEDDKVRVFKTEQVFCNAAYYNPKREEIIPVIVTLNTSRGAIIISCADGSFDCGAVARLIWPEGGGGKQGIGGSPRSKFMTESHLTTVVEKIRELMS
jgi:hypothetical protein